MADTIESHRVDIGRQIACSFRIQRHTNGSLFRDSDGSKEFFARSKALTESGQYSHVLVTDIADFFNQINVHRIENNLELANVPQNRAANVEKYLINLNTKDSRGIPIGPYASNILAELCLDDLDKRLLGMGATHVRYVDDLRIFCNSQLEAEHYLRDLTFYLHTTHRLSLQSAKTKIIKCDDIAPPGFDDPEEEENRAKQTIVQQLIDEFRSNTGYFVREKDLDKDTIDEAIRGNIKDLFAACLSSVTSHYALIRYLLRRAASLRLRVLYPLILESLSSLAPVIRDVCQYLDATLAKTKNNEHVREVFKTIQSSSIVDIPFVRLWILDLLANNPTLTDSATAMQFASQSESSLGVRPSALIARAYKEVTWVREYRDSWGTLKPWDKRAVLYCTSILPRPERGKWLDVVKNRGDSLQALTKPMRRVDTRR